MARLLEVTGARLDGPRNFHVDLPALQLDAGGVAALYGPSGCGKTSILEAAFGLLRRAGWRVSGRAACGGVELLDAKAGDLRALRQRRLAFLPQDAHAALDPLVAVGRQITAATEPPAGVEAVHAVLRRLGIDDPEGLCQREPHRISGGQAQRALLAIAFLRRPELVIADEPSASLDGGSYAELRDCLRELVAAGSALLMATHDHRLLDDLDADVYAFVDGAFVRGQPSQAAWPAPPPARLGALPVLQARGIEVAFGARAVLAGIDLEVHRGEVVALLGESGAGKSTLLRVLAGHRRCDRGAVERPPRRSAVQLVCQDAHGSLTPRRRLDGLLREACAPYFDARAGAAGLRLDPAVLQRTSTEMSGGERRRAALLRALAVQPDVLLLDEPTASLDRDAAVAVVDNLLTMQRSRALALVVATHDETLADAIAHRQVRLRSGRLEGCG